jgi:hypothetical protein
LNYTGNLTPRRSSVDYTGYIFVPLSTPLTAAAFTVDSFSTLGKTLIDTSVHFGAPANIKAVLVSIGFRDSGSAGSDCYIILSPNNTAGSGLASRCSGLPNDTYANATVVVPCNVNGDIYYQIQASGSGTFEVTLQIWGYWI